MLKFKRNFRRLKVNSPEALNIRNKFNIECVRRNVNFVPVSSTSSSADLMESTRRFVIYPVFSSVAKCLE